MKKPRDENRPELAGATTPNRLAAWLREWELDRRLRAVALDGAAAGPGSAAATVPPARWRPRAGDLALLHPSVTPACDRPLYVALLRPEGDRAWWAVPFSRFSEPASNGEWLTGRRAAALRVLCAWNGRKMPAHRIATGWKVGRFSHRELRAAATVERAWRDGATLSSAERTAVGAPITHPRDPRRAYMEEEASFMDAAAGGAESRESGGEITDSGSRGYVVGDSILLKAADASPPPHPPVRSGRRGAKYSR